MAELKEQALLERIGQLTVTYEDKIADLRVELTKISQELQNLRQQAQPAEVVEGTVVP